MWCRFRVHQKVTNHRKFTATLGGKNSLTKEKVFLTWQLYGIEKGILKNIYMYGQVANLAG